MQRDLEDSLAETADYKKKLEESEEQNRSLRKVARLYNSEKFAHNVSSAFARAKLGGRLQFGGLKLNTTIIPWNNTF